ncbi:unnamed protein product [Lampetra fluviatilis]
MQPTPRTVQGRGVDARSSARGTSTAAGGGRLGPGGETQRPAWSGHSGRSLRSRERGTAARPALFLVRNAQRRAVGGGRPRAPPAAHSPAAPSGSELRGSRRCTEPTLVAHAESQHEAGVWGGQQRQQELRNLGPPGTPPRLVASVVSPIVWCRKYPGQVNYAGRGSRGNAARRARRACLFPSRERARDKHRPAPPGRARGDKHGRQRGRTDTDASATRRADRDAGMR